MCMVTRLEGHATGRPVSADVVSTSFRLAAPRGRTVKNLDDGLVVGMPGGRKFEVTTFQEVDPESMGAISLPGRTVLITKRLLSQALEKPVTLPILEFGKLDSSVEITSFGQHLDSVIDSGVRGFVEVAGILKKDLVNNTEQMPNSVALTQRLERVAAQLAVFAEGGLDKDYPELDNFITNVHVFAQDVFDRQQAGAHITPIEQQIYNAAQNSLVATHQLEVLGLVSKIPGFDTALPTQKDTMWKLALLQGGSTHSAEQYAVFVRQSQEAGAPLERVVADTLAHLWEGFGVTQFAVHESPSHAEIPPSVVELVREGTAVMQQTLRNHSGNKPLGEIAQSVHRFAEDIRQQLAASPSLSPIATEVLVGIETFSKGLQQYQGVEAIISRPHAELLTQENLERMLALEQFVQEHPHEIGSLRQYAYAIDTRSVFGYVNQKANGYPTEAAYLLAKIQNKMTRPEALNPKSEEARKIARTPLPAAPRFVGDRWGTMLVYDEGERKWVWGYPPAPEGYAEAYNYHVALVNLPVGTSLSDAKGVVWDVVLPIERQAQQIRDAYQVPLGMDINRNVLLLESNIGIVRSAAQRIAEGSRHAQMNHEPDAFTDLVARVGNTINLTATHERNSVVRVTTFLTHFAPFRNAGEMSLDDVRTAFVNVAPVVREVIAQGNRADLEHLWFVFASDSRDHMPQRDADIQAALVARLDKAQAALEEKVAKRRVGVGYVLDAPAEDAANIVPVVEPLSPVNDVPAPEVQPAAEPLASSAHTTGNAFAAEAPVEQLIPHRRLIDMLREISPRNLLGDVIGLFGRPLRDPEISHATLPPRGDLRRAKVAGPTEEIIGGRVFRHPQSRG